MDCNFDQTFQSVNLTIAEQKVMKFYFNFFYNVFLFLKSYCEKKSFEKQSFETIFEEIPINEQR